MPTISVPDPLATYIVYGVFLCLCFGQWVIGFFVSPRYRRASKRAKSGPLPPSSVSAAEAEPAGPGIQNPSAAASGYEI